MPDGSSGTATRPGNGTLRVGQALLWSAVLGDFWAERPLDTGRMRRIPPYAPDRHICHARGRLRPRFLGHTFWDTLATAG